MKRDRLADPLEDGESFYVVIPQIAPFRRDEYHDPIWTGRAMSPEEAAQEAHDKIHAENSTIEPEYTEEMFVIAFEPEDVHTFIKGTRYDAAAEEFECCGGNDYTGHGHAATCPTLNRDV